LQRLLALPLVFEVLEDLFALVLESLPGFGTQLAARLEILESSPRSPSTPAGIVLSGSSFPPQPAAHSRFKAQNDALATKIGLKGCAE